GSGSPRSYYLGVATASDSEKQAICLVERGLDEGSVIDLPQMPFEVRANEPVSFDVYSSSFRSGDAAGHMLPIDDTLTPMPPLQTVIRFGKNGDKKTIPVTLGAEYTEMGSLSMYCHSRVSDHRWKLQFQLRDSGEKALNTAETEVYDQSVINAACRCLTTLFSDPGAAGLASAAKQIEAQVEQTRLNWPLSFLRALADQLIDLKPERHKSAGHEARWLNLTGFCMRPGFGDAFDADRIRKLWKVYLAGLTFDKAPQNRLEWWIFIRRIAAGLNAGQQRQFFQDIATILIKQKIKLPSQEMVEVWMTAGNLERLLVKDKVTLAKALIPQIKPGKIQDRLLWTLARFGARDLLYGSVDRVVPPTETARWIQQLMKRSWSRQDHIDVSVAQMSMKTGDRNRDLDPETVQN
ncbi:MAG: molecular chaperone DnaK, partial [Desulfobacteraceae bacterium]|nr:molecular chaperone DnaK [Desulfobacteraceae bacterium]